MTYCFGMSSYSESKPLILRVSWPPSCTISNSFAYKYDGVVACRATRRAPIQWLDPLPPSGRNQHAAARENKLTGVPSWPVGRTTPPGVATRGIALPEIL
jgi:hypothetical protein